MLYTIKFVKKFFENDVLGLAAQTTFYLVLSILPLMFFLVSVLSSADITADGMMFLQFILPASVLDILEDAILAGSPSMGNYHIASILVTIWSASNSIYALMKGVHKAYVKERLRFNLRARGVAILFTIAFAVAIIASLSTIVIWESITKKAITYFGIMPAVLDFMRYIVAAFAVFLFALALYYFTLESKIKPKYLLFGAAFTGLGWVITSQMFEYYIKNFNRYSLIYGGVGTFIGLLLWLFVICVIILVGAEINSLFTEKDEDNNKLKEVKK